MDTLLTWSGEASHEIALFFRNWLPNVLPGTQPWISDEDIAKGKKWFPELMVQLDKTHVSITFITPENVRSPWVFYEVGVIAAKLESGIVCPYLIGIDIKLVKDTPLGQFQCTLAEKADTWKLIRSINGYLGERKHDDRLLEGKFTSQWPKLKRQIDKVIESLGVIQDEVTETEPSIEEQLSKEARQLLVAASQHDGHITYAQWMGGSSINAGGRNYLGEYSPRLEAIWKGALDELLSFTLAEDRGYKGEVFRLTRLGYEVAERIISRRADET